VKPGDPVAVTGRLLGREVYGDDDWVLVRLDDNSTIKVRAVALQAAGPKVLPEHLIAVERADLRAVLDPSNDTARYHARQRLLGALDREDVRPGDVWKDRVGTRWFACSTNSMGALVLASEKPGGLMFVGDVAKQGLELEWRRGGTEPR
jgi:hypothetical protein